MNLELKAFDKSQLNHIDEQLRKLVDETYDLCLFKCNEKNTNGLEVCKSNCFKNVIVPYRYNNHMAKNDEENLYRKCLA